jgi:hypothetical protein
MSPVNDPQLPLLLLGVGNVGLAAARYARSAFTATADPAAGGSSQRKIIGTTRDPKRIFDLFHENIEPVVMPWPSAEVIQPLAQNAHVLVSFPPDGKTDAILAPACLQAESIVYISSTTVYGKQEGVILDTTAVEASDELAAPRIEAEKIWRAIGANVLRAPGIYGPQSGLHKRLLDGTYKLPGDGNRMSSRIHIDDLVQFIFALFASGKQGETYVVGDALPATHREVAAWLCNRMGVPAPAESPLDAVHHTLRGNRSIDASRALGDLNVKLKYPTYKEGYEACLQQPSED